MSFHLLDTPHASIEPSQPSANLADLREASPPTSPPFPIPETIPPVPLRSPLVLAVELVVTEPPFPLDPSFTVPSSFSPPVISFDERFSICIFFPSPSGLTIIPSGYALLPEAPPLVAIFLVLAPHLSSTPKEVASLYASFSGLSPFASLNPFSIMNFCHCSVGSPSTCGNKAISSKGRALRSSGIL
ncbi:hypothetical protein AMTR_s00037p00168900 [Amborella trichopoda]|uniref:Uncharacterized protein n=1 Tax=Amborella trichopoda TaxID=13333 RepID=U5DAE6_AMBTC|nr:hypothetical protein AMTR_s00037p00168900 [Amborella trichopoda]